MPSNKTKSKSVLNSKKPYYNPKALRGQDKVEPTGPILGAKPKWPHPLDKKFFGCSSNNDPGEKSILDEERLREALRNFISTKAGFIPYCRDSENGKIYMLFVKSSDPAYGGSKWQISKGMVDAGEKPIDTALREAQEEMGLNKANIKNGTIQLGWQGRIAGDIEEYDLAIFIGEIISKTGFGKPDFEIAGTRWMTIQEFFQEGRRSHQAVVNNCFQKIESK